MYLLMQKDASVMEAPAKYSRIIVRFPGHDKTREAWAKGIVGIWYGAWTAEEFERALARPDPIEYIASLPHQRALGWKPNPFPDACFKVGQEFARIAESDWVYSYFDDSLHLGQLHGKLQSNSAHEWNFEGEVFKYRTLRNEKEFSLSALPDSFRLLTMVGRGGLNPVPSGTHEKLIAILAASASTAEAKQAIAVLPWQEWVAILAPKCWESLCLAYLIRKVGFVPTGMDVGRTMGDFDIIGRDSDGNKVFAQCKKNPRPAPISAGFLIAASNRDPKVRYFYFAYGGCSGVVPEGMKVLRRDDIERWLEEDAPYLGWLRS
jgi:hypothetical protein